VKLKRILMVAYHFPPLAGSSGIQRTLRFAQHLPSFGWEPAVLTANPRSYERTSGDLDSEVPPGMIVRRAFALDATRHLSIAGRHLAWTARPDRWSSWRFDGVRQGLHLIEELQPDLIFSTYPIATAHVIASALHRRSGIPWVADFRDPMAQQDYPTDPKTWAAYKQIEEHAARGATLCLFTTPSAARDFSARYIATTGRVAVLENGYDEDAFLAAERSAVRGGLSGKSTNPMVLLHSGIIYHSERNPQHLMAALRALRDSGSVDPSRLRVRFRAAVHEEFVRQLAAAHGVLDLIELCPPLAYEQALREMLEVDALLVMQASNCNAQIPAKVYEYLRARRPILALTDPAGDTAGLLRAAGVRSIAPLDSTEGIAATLRTFVDRASDGAGCVPTEAAIMAASRRGRAQELASMLDALLA
jgi:hypothetical protein